MSVLVSVIFHFVRYSIFHPAAVGAVVPSFHLPQLGQSLSNAISKAPGNEYFAPGQNLEHVDEQLIDESRGPLDIAMYAFTDHAIADAVVRAANRGQTVRIYRDWQQYKEEEGRDQYVARAFANNPNISIRVKGTRDLMHLKEFSDGKIVREGSANWSPSGEKKQDNSIVVLSDALSVNAFKAKFQEMWDRPNNFQVQ